MTEASLRETARTIFLSALADCSIEKSFRERVRNAEDGSDGTRLLFGEHLIAFSGLRYLRIIAVGKAAGPMLCALLARLPKLPSCEISGVIIAPGAAIVPAGFQHFTGGHPFPNSHSFAGARRVLSLLECFPPDASEANALVIFLVSGGASAMMELPLDPHITLEETVAFHRALVHSGASITEINCVRKHFSAVKGGRLRLMVRSAACLTILLSDVPAGKLDTIASGPTLPDTSTREECSEILGRYGLLNEFPDAIRNFFNESAMRETVKPGDLESRVWTILSADDVAQAARTVGERLGFRCEIDNTCDDWDYRKAAEYLLRRTRQARSAHERICLLSAGEIAVRTHSPEAQAGRPIGNGGRNQHFALYAAILLQDSDAPLAILSAGTDGIDGHSDATGAVVSTETLSGSHGGVIREAQQRRAQQALADFQSSAFLESVGARIVTGATGNNLRDLRIFITDC